MLEISRKYGERIRRYNNQFDRDYSQLREIGIDAPKEISIHREQTYLKVQNKRSKFKAAGEVGKSCRLN